MEPERSIRAQPGKQELFLSHSADICIYGGAAGGGKTFALLLEPCYNIGNPHFEAVIFRQQLTQIMNAGGLWDVSMSVYPLLGGIPVRTPRPYWTFPSGAKVSFAHIWLEKEVNAWQGSQIPLLCCEENTKIRMGDMSLKPLKDIRTGDMVLTTEGPRRVTARGRRRLRDCVEVSFRGGMKQIQTSDHRILTDRGWYSYDDLTDVPVLLRIPNVITWEQTGKRGKKLTFRHPYTGESRSIPGGQWKRRSAAVRPAGKHYVIDITVNGENSYITEAGLINRNCFDELTHFSERTFFYMLSRNRSTCGVKPYVRATCNPDADSWVAKFISWWIDQESGYPIEERCGKTRWFLRRDETIYWADRKEELWEKFGLKTENERNEPKSVSFINSTLQDNQILLNSDPGYLANLKALPLVERERLLHGNWRIRPAGGLFFKRLQLKDILEVVPSDVIQWVRCWDLAASEKNADGDASYTAGVLMGKRKNGEYIVADVINRQLQAAEVRALIRQTAQQDIAKYRRVRIRLPQDPGQAGKEQAESYVRFLSGFDVRTVVESGSKESRAEPMAAQWQGGNFSIVHAPWNAMYLDQLESFPESRYKDMVDASANAFAEIELRSQFNLRNLL